MSFSKYMHIERLGTSSVNGIEIGKVYVFPKIDGTNGSVWYENGKIHAGSRNRELTIEDDNAGFCKYIMENEALKKFFKAEPRCRLFGEWLVPHTLKTYREDAWKRFYIFDVMLDNVLDHKDEHSPDEVTGTYLAYDLYKPMLDQFELDYIQPICTITNGSYEDFIKLLDKNTFLIEDGKGIGEGIVLKRYDYKNKYGHTIWAKVVKQTFKEKHTKTMGHASIDAKKLVEKDITDIYCNRTLTEKTIAKITTENDGWESRYIPQLLGRVYHDIIAEEMWDILKKFKSPTINFRTLQYLINNKVKELHPEIF